MGWFSSFFSSPPSSSGVNARRNLAMSTHDAFSLPTASPLSSSHQDAFSAPHADTPDVESATPSMYAYPPMTSSPTKHDYPSSAKFVAQLQPVTFHSPCPPQQRALDRRHVALFISSPSPQGLRLVVAATVSSPRPHMGADPKLAHKRVSRARRHSQLGHSSTRSRRNRNVDGLSSTLCGPRIISCR